MEGVSVTRKKKERWRSHPRETENESERVASEYIEFMLHTDSSDRSGGVQATVGWMG